MKQFHLTSVFGIAMRHVFFADALSDIPEFWLQNYTIEETEALEYWISDEIRAEVARSGWCHVDQMRLQERSLPKPPKAIWFHNDAEFFRAVGL